jgi:hypothetical protein
MERGAPSDISVEKLTLQILLSGMPDSTYKLTGALLLMGMVLVLLRLRVDGASQSPHSKLTYCNCPARSICSTVDCLLFIPRSIDLSWSTDSIGV